MKVTFDLLYMGREERKRKPCVFQVGDVMCVSKQKLTFLKEYETNWTEELLVVTK